MRSLTVEPKRKARRFSLYRPAVLLCGLLLLLISQAAANPPPPHSDTGHGPGHGGEPAGDNQPHGEHDPGAEGEGHDGEHGGEHGGNHSKHEVHRFQVAKFDFAYVKPNFIVAVWILYACGAKIFFHWEKYLSKIFPESCLLIIIGVILGIFLYFANEKGYELNITLFFLVILPPIILDAGYYMPARSFFDQLGTILLYAILGTLLNTLFLGFALWGVYEGGGFENLESPLLLLDSLVFASLLAAVDPVAVLAVFESVHVNEILYIIVFGESLLNDGISVVLYHLFEGLSEIGAENILPVDVVAGVGSFFVIVFGATGIGMLLGLCAGFMSRFTKHVRIMEPLIVFVIGYLSFVIAEMFHLSGIISCTFCGITMRKYVEANFSQKSQTTIRYVLKLAASTSETIIFMYIGVSAVSDTHHWDTAFVILTLVFCLIFRTLGVIILTFFANMVRVVKLTKIDQFIMAYGGLRGAIAFALVVLLDAEHFKHRRMFITSTVVVVYFTNIAMGSTIKALVTFLKVKRAEHRTPSMGEKIVYRFMDHVMGGIEDITDQKGHHLLRERFSTFNNNYLKPFIVGKKNPQRRGWQILSVYNRINEKVAKKFLKRSDSTPSHLYRNVSYLDLNRTTSISQLFAPKPSGIPPHAGFGNWWDSNGSLPQGMNSPEAAFAAHQQHLRNLEHERKTSVDIRNRRKSEDVEQNKPYDSRIATSDPNSLHTSPHPHQLIFTVTDPSQSIQEEASPGINGKKVSFADNYRRSIDMTGVPAHALPAVFPVLPDAEFVSSESEDDLEGGTALYPRFCAERRQPTELELSLPWKRMEDEDDVPVVSPSFLPPSMDFRLIDHRTPPTASAAAVEFQLSSPDSSDQASGVRGITNPGFVEDGDRLSGAGSPLPSSSSSSAAASDAGNTNNNNRRGRPDERGSGREVVKDETGKGDGQQQQQQQQQQPPVAGKDQKDDAAAVVSIEMHEIGLKD